MSRFQRVKSIVFAMIMLLFAFLVLMLSEDDYDIIAAIIGIGMTLYGIRQMIYYFLMARHMVGGKIVMCKAIIILDLSLVTFSLTGMSAYTILFYLLGISVFSGVIGILRAFEAKKNGASFWKRKFLTGLIMVLFGVIMTVFSLIFDDKSILLYGFVISLIYFAVVRIVTACRKTSIVYIH